MRPGFLQKPVLSIPAGVDPKHYFVCLLGPLALGVSAGIQVTMSAFLLLGPAGDSGFAAQLTEYGKDITRPEHDLLIYVAGALFTLLAAGLMGWYWRGKLATLEASKAPAFMAASALLEGLLAAVSMTVYALLLCSTWFSRDFRTAVSIRPPTSEFEAVTLLGTLSDGARLCSV